ncbi:MAG: small multi-drug export protein [Candidatus Cloacimonetes bacterium]|nr:small multi-drug export protein [Candidatus Cloacimonadota bacterium]
MTKSLLLICLILLLWLNLAASDWKGNIRQKVDDIQISPELKVFLIAMIPIFELRGAIPIGRLYYQLPIWKVFPLAVAGNMVPIFLILLCFDLVAALIGKIPFMNGIMQAVLRRTRAKSNLMEKYEEIGLMLFVAIPLPVTGAWTGSLAAYLFGFGFWKSILFIFLGVLIAGVVVTFLTSLKWIGAGLALLALIYFRVKDARKRRENGEKC